MSSIRLRGLSSDEQFAQIKNHIRSLTHPNFIQSSGVAETQHGFEATITLKDTANKIEALAILDRFLPEDFPTVQVDDGFLGVTTLVSPTTPADDETIFDVVAVHGLGGHGANTWTCSKPVAQMWIRDFLPQSFSNARVMTFGYESRVLSRSTGGIQEAAMQLLNGLMLRRGKEESLQRPLLFMAHSLGGLIVKAALSLAKSRGTYGTINAQTFCIAFFGTPHKGSESANWAKVIARIVSVCKTVEVRNLDVLKRDSNALFDLEQNFTLVLRDNNINILSLFELQRTKIRLFRKIRLSRNILIVPKQSAVLCLPNETPIPVNSCHRQMCRFPSQHDPDYETLVDRVRHVLAQKQASLASNPRTEMPGKRPKSDDLSSPATRAQITYPTYIPYDSHFVGREGLMTDVEAHLLAGSADTKWPPCVALVGMPGMGKTSLAKRVVQRTRQHFDWAFFLSAESEPKLLQDFRDVFRLLNPGDGETPEDMQTVRGLVIDHLTKTDKRWLLVFDNADESRLLLASWPHQGNGSVIVTSRNTHISQSLPPNIVAIPVNSLTEKQGEDFLRSRLKFQHTGERGGSLCRGLARRFHCWPLALRQLSAFMDESHTGEQEMWDLLEKTSDVDSRIYSYSANSEPYECTLEAAWNAILSKLPGNSARLLNILSLLDPDKIPGQLFPRHDISQSGGFEFLTNEFEYRAARGPLLKYDIITITDTNIMSIHRAVQSTRLKLISHAERQEAFDMALSTLRVCFPSQVLGDHMHGVWDGCEAFLAHVLAFNKAVQDWRPSLGDTATYINKMCDCTWYLWEVGQYDEALKLLDQAESVCAQTVGLHSLEATRIYVNRGSVFSTLNRYDEAGKMFERGLQIRRALLPENSSLLANSYMQMGNYYTSQGQVEDAVRAHRHVIGIREKAPETPPGIMIISYFNICRSLLMGNRVDEAEAYLRRAEGLEPQLGQGREAFSYRSGRLYILGNIMSARGEISAAHRIHVGAYEARAKGGSTQYGLAASLHKIGTLLEKSGKRDQAITTLGEAVALLESVPGTAKAKLSRLARTEIKLAEILLPSDEEGLVWRRRAHQHYCDAFKLKDPVEDWSEIDFDCLVPPIDR